MPICDSGSHAKSIRSESGPIPLFHFNCFRCRLLGVRNWVEEDDDVEGRASVCWRSPKGFLDAMQAGTKGLGLPKRGSLLPIHSSSWRLKVVAFWDVSSTTDAGTSGATSARSRSCRSFWFLPSLAAAFSASTKASLMRLLMPRILQQLRYWPLVPQFELPLQPLQQVLVVVQDVGLHLLGVSDGREPQPLGNRHGRPSL